MGGNENPQAETEVLMSERELFEEKFKGVYDRLDNIDSSTKTRLDDINRVNTEKLLFFEKLICGKLDRIEDNTRRTNGHVRDLFEADAALKKAMHEADKELEVKIARVDERLRGGWGYFIKENPKVVALAIIVILALLGINLFDLTF